jgi:DNA-binding winged helix-turn-helix (wHTH) protein
LWSKRRIHQRRILKDIDEFAKSLIKEVNTIHKTGYNLNGTTNVSFFSDIDKDYAKNIDVNELIKSDAEILPPHPQNSNLRIMI